jgi:hypothetical protein
VSVAPDAPSPSAFLVSVAVPAGTPAGTYRFDLAATAGGADAGHAVLTVKVDGPKPGHGKSKKACQKAKRKGHGRKHAKAKCASSRRQH